MEQIFNREQQEKAQFILNHPLARLSDLRPNEIKDLAVVWCEIVALQKYLSIMA